jgi:hypothetical protein
MFETILNWINTHESIGIWVEAIALVAIFILDWRERKDQRKDREDQHKETLAQLQVSQDQVEAAQKPCLVFSATPRAPEDAILEIRGSNSLMSLLCPEGQAQLENIGNGPAVDARYSLAPIDPASTVVRPSGYLVTVLSGQKILTPIARGILQGNEWQIIITYESLTRCKYTTRMTANDLVLTGIEFEQAPIEA